MWSSVSSSWVCLVVHLLQPLDAGMGVHLRRAERSMSQQLLHRAQVGSRVQHVSGEAVPKRMHPQPVAANGIEHPVNDPLDAARREPPAPATHEYRAPIGATVGEDRLSEPKI